MDDAKNEAMQSGRYLGDFERLEKRIGEIDARLRDSENLTTGLNTKISTIVWIAGVIGAAFATAFFLFLFELIDKLVV